MPKITVNNAQINYKFLDNKKPETMVFSNSLGTNYSMWTKQEAEVSKYFNILFYDTRGHGESETTEGAYSAELLGKDVLALTKSLNIEKFHFCGLSMGSLIGQWLALNGGDRVQKIILCNTAAKIGTEESWNERIELVLEKGLETVAEATPAKWFSDGFIKDNKDDVDQILAAFKKNSPEGYASNCAMVRDADFRDGLEAISKPVLIISASLDPVTTVADGNEIQMKIQNSEHIILNAKHLSAFEKPAEFNEALLKFLQKS